MGDEFAQWREALGDMPRRAEEVCEGLTDEQLNWKPGKDRWSIAQCLDHLNRANTKILGQLDAGIAKAKATGRRRTDPWRAGFLERFFIRMVGARAPIKSPVPPDFLPADRAFREEILPRFRELHDRYVGAVEEVKANGIVHVKVPSAVSKLVKCTLGTWFAATIEHDLYHLGQAEQVRTELDAHVEAAT